MNDDKQVPMSTVFFLLSAFCLVMGLVIILRS